MSEERDQVAYRREDEIDTLGELTDTEIYEGELEAGVHDDLPTEPRADNLESLTALELRAGETDDPSVAAEEGMTYVPPTDPPVVPDPDDPQGVRVAAGFGSSALDEPYDSDHRSELLDAEDDASARVREALRADARTTQYADSLAIATRGSTVAVRGVVDDLDDSDNVLEVVNHVTGVADVIDELEVRGV
jgi:BON domain